MGENPSVQPLPLTVELDIIKKAQTGDEKAKELLYFQYKNLIIKVATSYMGMGFPLEELISDGKIGFFIALKKFDTTKNLKFGTYMVWWIKAEILRSIKTTGRLIRISNNKITEINCIRKKYNNLIIENFSTEEILKMIANSLNLPLKRVYEALDLMKDTVSLDKLLDEYGDQILSKTINNVENEVCNNLSMDYVYKKLNKILSLLSKEEIKIIEDYYYKEKTLREMGDERGVTYETVRLNKKKILDKLKNLAEVELLEYYI